MMQYATIVNSFLVRLFLFVLLLIAPTFAHADSTKSIERAGDVIQVAIPAIAYGTTFYLDDKEGRTQFHKSFATNFVATHGLKHAINREHPLEN